MQKQGTSKESGRMSPRPSPWYKRKYDRAAYLSRGEPLEVHYDNILTTVPGWKPSTPNERELGHNFVEVVLQKNTKREFLITPSEKEKVVAATKNRDGRLEISIEVLHKDYRGFVFTAAAETREELDIIFWPAAAKLLAFLVGPKMHGRSPYAHRNGGTEELELQNLKI